MWRLVLADEWLSCLARINITAVGVIHILPRDRLDLSGNRGSYIDVFGLLLHGADDRRLLDRVATEFRFDRHCLFGHSAATNAAATALSFFVFEVCF